MLNLYVEYIKAKFSNNNKLYMTNSMCFPVCKLISIVSSIHINIINRIIRILCFKMNFLSEFNIVITYEIKFTILSKIIIIIPISFC